MAEHDEALAGPGTDLDALDAEQAEEGGKGGGKTFLIILVVVLVAALAGGGFAAYAFQAQAISIAAKIGLGPTTAMESAGEPIDYGEFTEFHGLIINPSDSEGRRYLMVNIGIEAADGKILDEINRKEIVIRDQIIRLLGSLTVAQLASIETRDTLKKQCIDVVNGVLSEGQIERLYFTGYVLQ